MVNMNSSSSSILYTYTHTLTNTLLHCQLSGKESAFNEETQKTQIRFLSHEDPLEKEVATHSSVLAWQIPWTEEPGGLQSMRSQRVGNY